MSNQASTRRAPAADWPDAVWATARRRRVRRTLLPAAAGFAACLLLAVAGVAEGHAAPVVLAIWIALMIGVGVWLSAPERAEAHRVGARQPVLVLAELYEDGDLGPTQTHALVATPAAIAILDSRPSG